MDVELNPGPTSSSSRSIWKRPYRGCRSGRAVRVCEATKVFNIQPAMTLRLCHQFAFHSWRNENNLILFRWYHLGNAEVHHFVSVFGMLAHWNTKYHHYVISCYLIVLTFYLWLNRGLPRTIASPSPTLLEFTKRLRCLSFATIHSQMRWTSCHRTQRASSYGKWRLHVFYVRTLRFNYHLW